MTADDTPKAALERKHSEFQDMERDLTQRLAAVEAKKAERKRAQENQVTFERKCLEFHEMERDLTQRLKAAEAKKEGKKQMQQEAEREERRRVKAEESERDERRRLKAEEYEREERRRAKAEEAEREERRRIRTAEIAQECKSLEVENGERECKRLEAEQAEEAHALAEDKERRAAADLAATAACVAAEKRCHAVDAPAQATPPDSACFEDARSDNSELSGVFDVLEVVPDGEKGRQEFLPPERGMGKQDSQMSRNSEGSDTSETWDPGAESGIVVPGQLNGYLWKKSPSMSKFYKYQWRYFLVKEGRIRWWRQKEDFFSGQSCRGLLDLHLNVGEVWPEWPVKFALVPQGGCWKKDTPESALRGRSSFTGADSDRRIYLDATDSEHTTAVWIQAIEDHIQYASLLQDKY